MYYREIASLIVIQNPRIMPKATKPSFNLRDPTLPPPKRKRSQLSKLTYKAHEAPWRQRFVMPSTVNQSSRKLGNGVRKNRSDVSLSANNRRVFREVGTESDTKEAFDTSTKEELNSPILKATNLTSFHEQNDDDEAPPPEIDEFIDLLPPHEPNRDPKTKKEDQICSLLPPQPTIFTKQREIAEHRVKKMRKQSLSVKKRAYEDVIDLPM